MKQQIRHWVILIATLCVLGWLWNYFMSARPWDIRIPPIKNQAELPDYAFKEVVIRQVSGPKTYYTLRSHSLMLNKTNADLDGVSGNVYNDQGQAVMYFTGYKGLINYSNQTATILGFSGQTLSDKLWMVRAGSAIIQKDKQQVSLNGKPILWNKQVKLTAEMMGYVITKQAFWLNKQVQAEQGAYSIRSAKASLNEKTDSAYFSENVLLLAPDYKATAQEVSAAYSKNNYQLMDNVIIEHSDTTLAADYVSLNVTTAEVLLKKNVRLKYKDSIVQSERAVWNRDKKSVEFFEQTKGWRGDALIKTNQLIFDLGRKEFVSSGTGRTTLIKTPENE